MADDRKVDAGQIDGEPAVPGQDQWISLPALISDEFGTQSGVVRQEIIAGKVTVDGKEVDEKFHFKRDDILGKEIVIEGETRQYRLVYRDKKEW